MDTSRHTPSPAAVPQTARTDRRTELLARLEAALREELQPRPRDPGAGMNPYDTAGARRQPDAWGTRRR